MRVLLTAISCFLLSYSASAQSNSSSVFRFLDLTPTARASAVGGNHVGLYGGGVSLFHLNPAYLQEEAVNTVSATYINYLADANFGFTSGAFRVKGLGVIGVGIRYAGYGEFDLLDENGNDNGDFNAKDLAFTGGYSQKLAENLRAGASFDFIHSSYGTYQSSAVAVSGGLFYEDKPGRFSAGVSVKNLGAQITTFHLRREPLPLDIAVGISKKPESFPFQLSFTLKKLNDWDLRTYQEPDKPAFLNNLMRHVLIGGETLVGQKLYLRLGYDHYLHEQTKTGKTIELAGVAFGVGFNIKSIQIDLSRNSYSKLGGITRISLKTEIK
ncbi:MAG: type IX secretion system protein PorQ [Balneolaceae bacterium]|nr:type IX secretion system protein PorQ [Balneolaceae bacterium]